jgi:dipeptidyl aminopeptidase/acylaminoacyl peptidase
MRSYTYGATRLIEWKTTAGAPRRGTLLLPSNYKPGTRYPLVVYPYPTRRRSEDLNVFGVTGNGPENMQLLATRGFAVLAPDVPPIQLTDEMRELANVIMPGVDRAIALGIADSSRLGVMGHSWGGYTVLALLVQTPRFRAAMMRGGMGDNLAGYGTVESSGWAWEMGGTVWEQRERYIQNSPIYFFDRIRTPLLIIHGEGETTVPIYLADQVFASLQRLGKEVEYARYKGENHGERLWTRANQKDFLARTIGWFETKLTTENSR